MTVPHDLQQLLFAFDTPEVRDLAWVLLSPGILDSTDPRFQGRLVPDDWGRSQFQKHRKSLIELDRRPEPLLEWLEERAQGPLLGRYFEALAAFWFSRLIRPDKFFSNLPLKSGSDTLGEFDLLYQEEHDPVTRHREVSVKFFLQLDEHLTLPENPAVQSGDGFTSGFERYLGTNVRDRLDKKVSILLERQLQLSRRPEAEPLLKRLGMNAPSEARAILRGTLFYRLGTDLRSAPEVQQQGDFARGLSPAHSRGWWQVIDELDLPRSSPGSRWVILPKRRWLSPFISKDAMDERVLDERKLRAALSGHFLQRKAAVMLAEVIQEGAWHEIARGVVVTKEWPAAARAQLPGNSSN